MVQTLADVADKESILLRTSDKYLFYLSIIFAHLSISDATISQLSVQMFIMFLSKGILYVRSLFCLDSFCVGTKKQEMDLLNKVISFNCGNIDDTEESELSRRRVGEVRNTYRRTVFFK